MKVQSFSLPARGVSLMTECYLVSEGENAVLIDMPSDSDEVESALQESGAKLCAVLLTHGHFDHIGGVDAVSSRYGVPVYVGEEDAPMLSDPLQNASAAMASEPLICRAKPIGIKEGDILTFGSLAFTVLSTPGHTKGSVCYQTEGVLFTGDTLFCGGYGRTDLYGGSFSQMKASLRRLIPLSKTVSIYPGHI